MAGGWDSAADWSEQGDRPPRPAAPLRQQGARRLLEVICCPQCKSPAVERTHYRTGDVMAYWKCRDCPATWKEPAKAGTERTARLP